MDIEHFLESDIIAFLDTRVEQKGQIGLDREEEFGFYLTRDYMKEVTSALDNDEMTRASKIFNELREHYVTLPQESLEKKKIYALLEQMYGEIKKYADIHGIMIRGDVSGSIREGMALSRIIPEKISESHGLSELSQSPEFFESSESTKSIKSTVSLQKKSEANMGWDLPHEVDASIKTDSDIVGFAQRTVKKDTLKNGDAKNSAANVSKSNNVFVQNIALQNGALRNDAALQNAAMNRSVVPDSSIMHVDQDIHRDTQSMQRAQRILRPPEATKLTGVTAIKEIKNLREVIPRRNRMENVQKETRKNLQKNVQKHIPETVSMHVTSHPIDRQYLKQSTHQQLSAQQLLNQRSLNQQSPTQQSPNQQVFHQSNHQLHPTTTHAHHASLDELYALGMYTLFQKDYAEASKIFEKIIALHPQNKAAKIRLQECMEVMQHA